MFVSMIQSSQTKQIMLERVETAGTYLALIKRVPSSNTTRYKRMIEIVGSSKWTTDSVNSGEPAGVRWLHLKDIRWEVGQSMDNFISHC